MQDPTIYYYMRYKDTVKVETKIYIFEFTLLKFAKDLFTFMFMTDIVL